MRNFFILYFILICFAVLSKFHSFFINFVYFVLVLPLGFYDLKKAGFKNFKKGLFYGFFSSVVYLPFILKNLSFVHFLQIPQVFAEEFFFRGYGLPIFYEKFKNIHIANVFVSVLFTIPHVIINPSLFSVLVFFPSIIFGYLFFYSGSILASVIFHWFSNLFFQLFFYDFLVRKVMLSM